MRWLVEVTSLGRIESESLQVEADSWQAALQVARTGRGETSSMGSFSVEVRDSGCRAIDAASLSRYEVRQVADHADASAQPPSVAPAASVLVPTLLPPRPSSQPVKRASAAPSPAASPLVATEALAAAPTAPLPPQEVAATAPPPPEAAIAPVNGHGGGSSPPPSSRKSNPPTIPAQIVFKREQERTQALPLTYREYVYVVPLGTSEDDAQALLQTQLDLVQSSLDGMPAGKLVNLAVFDAQFQGKPQGTPVATLTWKDWRGAPVLSLPRRAAFAGGTDSSARHGADGPAPTSAATLLTRSDHAELAGGVPPPSARVSSPPSEPILLTKLVATEPPMADAPAAPLPRVIVEATPAASLPRAVEAPPAEPEPIDLRVALVPSAVVQPPEPPIDLRIVELPSVIVQGSPPASIRVRDEDLIADLFEVMHDLHFLRDAVEGGDFCLAVAMEKIPSLVGIVHLYDIDRREFVITNARGPQSAALLLRRHPETEPLLAGAMRRRRSIVLPDATQETASVERYAAVGGARSLVVAPVMQAGRFLGAIELLNPLDGQPFAPADGDAIGYIAQQFAEFVESRGVVTDPERISARRPRA